MLWWSVHFCEVLLQFIFEDLFVSLFSRAAFGVIEDVEGAHLDMHCQAFVQCTAGVAFLGANDPAEVVVSSCLLMPEVRKQLAYGASLDASGSFGLS
ncbi:hypothetical protein Nepgr_007983 [Nepenthes gracilis]|uniref:Secreted protein n=1 Tax=Nepenthes gracilis TaxID=150966 RepID=A0AAD3S802_NEPGR|nr:hypothetical protein Nepgr_007983 [Nepenthes gracilis]